MLKKLVWYIRLRIACFFVGSHTFDKGSCTLCGKKYKLPKAKISGKVTIRLPFRNNSHHIRLNPINGHVVALAYDGHIILRGKCIVCNRSVF